MKDEELRASDFPTTWDNTMRTQSAACKRKLYFFLRRFDYASRPAYFTFGSAWHEILAYWYQLPQEIIQNPGSLDYIAGSLVALDEGHKFWDKASPEPSADNRRENLSVLWKNYLRTFPTEPWTLLESEIGFEWPVAGTDYAYAGALDGRIEWKPYGLLALEHKTSGSYLGRSALDFYYFSTQQTGQIWYLYQLQGEMPFGCVLNIITKKIPGAKSNWKTERCERLTIRKSRFKLDNFVADLCWDIEDFRRCWNQWHFPMTSDSIQCVGGVAKAPCLFKPICLSSGDYRKADIGYYDGIIERPEAWEPWKRKGAQDD